MSIKAAIPRKSPAFVLCIEHGEYEGELVVGKVYGTRRAERNDPVGDVRVIDESGDDYLYPAAWFVPVDVPAKARRILGIASK